MGELRGVPTDPAGPELFRRLVITWVHLAYGNQVQWIYSLGKGTCVFGQVRKLLVTRVSTHL